MNKGKFGDMFLFDDLIFRIYNNHHPKSYFIAYPIYKLEENKLSKINLEETTKKYLKPIGKNLNVPLIKITKIDKYFDCLSLGDKLSKNLLQDYEYIKKRLNKIGITKVGITGSTYLKSQGYSVGNKRSDIDIIVLGVKNSKTLLKKLHKLYSNKFQSYKSRLKKLYYRRKFKSSPFFIDYETIKMFESVKPIGIYNGRHINITPTYKGENSIFDIEKIKREKIGLVKTRIKILDFSKGYSVPGYYSISSFYRGKKIEILRSNFFFYMLCKELDSFEVCGDLIKEIINNKIRYVIDLDTNGDYKRYFMNISLNQLKDRFKS